MKRGKKYVEAAKAVDRATLYDTAEAISLVKKSAVAKLDVYKRQVHTAVSAVAKREINNAIFSAIRNCRLGYFVGEFMKTASTSASQDHR